MIKTRMCAKSITVHTVHSSIGRDNKSDKYAHKEQED